MNQTAIGKFIALKRKEQNLTQGQLAEKLGISNKTISKWETAAGLIPASWRVNGEGPFLRHPIGDIRGRNAHWRLYRQPFTGWTQSIAPMSIPSRTKGIQAKP